MISKIDDFITSKSASKILCIVILFLLLLGIKNRFIQDDAFISFRYAQNFVQGHGLTWNIGEHKNIEGYTNFLWVIMIAFVEALGLDPVSSSMVLGILFAVGTLFFTYRLSLMLLQSRLVGLLTVILLGTNYSFSSYMTGGLETQLQSFLIVCSTYCTFCIIHRNKSLEFVGLSGLFSLAVMTRLDSALICCVLYLFVLSSLLKTRIAINKKIVLLSSLTLPGLSIVGAWLFFKFFYYGDILPNTYYVKAADFSIETFLRGGWYVCSFFYNYFLIPFVLLGIIYFKKIFSQSSMRVILVIMSLWLIYTIKVGGDFMEYRFLVPILPFMFLLISNVLLLINNSIIQMALIILVFVGSFFHAVTFNGSRGIESISSLNSHIVSPSKDWRGVGIVLGEIFSNSVDPVTIAVTAAGAIPYYSKLPTIDMLGLNDKWVAINGIKIGTRPGHTKYTTLEYLIERDVNLLIGHPKVTLISANPITNLKKYFWVPIDTSLLSEKTKVLEIPLNTRYKIQILYLKRHEYIDECIEKLNLKTYKITK